MYRELARPIVQWLTSHGFDPLIFFGLLALGFLFLRRKDIADFKKLDPPWRGLVRAQIIGCILLVVIAVLDLAGLLSKKPMHQNNSSAARDTTHSSATTTDTVFSTRPINDSLEHGR